MFKDAWEAGALRVDIKIVEMRYERPHPCIKPMSVHMKPSQDGDFYLSLMRKTDQNIDTVLVCSGSHSMQRGGEGVACTCVPHTHAT